MSIIQRPTKQGNATTYQGKVAAGYTKILASEVDADLDLIYSAWNQGVDTVNIQDGSITGSKLAPGAVGSRELQDGGIQTVDIGDAQVTAGKLVGGGAMGGDLTGTYPNPAVGTVQSGIIGLNPRMRLVAGATASDIQANSGPSPGYDASKSTWLMRADYGADRLDVYRAPPGSGTFSIPLSLNASGFITNHAWGGALYNNAVQPGFGSGASNIEMVLPTVWYDNGSTISTANGNHLTVPGFPSGVVWCLINGELDITSTTGFGFGVGIQYAPAAAGPWSLVRQTFDVTQTTFSVCALWPLPTGSQLRLVASNATGGSITITWCSLSMVILGQ